MLRYLATRIVPIAIGLLIPVASLALPIDDAKLAFAAGKAAFERGEFETALAEFQRADGLAPAPSLSYNIGSCYERLGRFHDAATVFERYLERVGPPPTEAEKDFQKNLRARIVADKKRAGQAAAVTAQPAPPVAPPALAAAPYYYPILQSPDAYRKQQLKDLRSRKARSIALMTIGLTLDLAGAILLGYALVLESDPSGISQPVEGFFGASAALVGLTLWIPGAMSYVRADRELRELSKPPGQPKALIFSLPPIRF